jgi:hypothetical protein
MLCMQEGEDEEDDFEDEEEEGELLEDDEVCWDDGGCSRGDGWLTICIMRTVALTSLCSSSALETCAGCRGRRVW